MFLELLRRRNPALLQAAASLHRLGVIPPNCYVIDLDALGDNTRKFKRAADAEGLRAFAMTKQIGRNPDASRVIASAGIDHAVGVDLECAVASAAGGLSIGHLGHLVQIPRHSADAAASLSPNYWTIFSETKAKEASAAAAREGREQNILARIFAPGDHFYRGHEGGFEAAKVAEVADMIDSLPFLRFCGVTSFPATLFDPVTSAAVSTPNLGTLSRAVDALHAAGRNNVQLNAPGTTSASILKRLSAAGATQVEPGHGLTGTTPLHAVRDLAELPAIAYVSEVSHRWGTDAYVFGGGMYLDPVLGSVPTTALVVRDGERVDEAPAMQVEMPKPEAIDYYATLTDAPLTVAEGDTVLFGFRPQVFVTRGLTAGLTGVSTGNPTLAGIWSADGSHPLGLDDAVAGLGTASRMPSPDQ